MSNNKSNLHYNTQRICKHIIANTHMHIYVICIYWWIDSMPKIGTREYTHISCTFCLRMYISIYIYRFAECIYRSVYSQKNTYIDMYVLKKRFFGKNVICLCILFANLHMYIDLYAQETHKRICKYIIYIFWKIHTYVYIYNMYIYSRKVCSRYAHGVGWLR